MGVFENKTKKKWGGWGNKGGKKPGKKPLIVPQKRPTLERH